MRTRVLVRKYLTCATDTVSVEDHRESRFEALTLYYKSFTKLLTLHEILLLPYKIFRSSHQRCSFKKDVLRNFVKFTGKHLCQSLFFNKVAGLQNTCGGCLWYSYFHFTPASLGTRTSLLIYVQFIFHWEATQIWWMWRRREHQTNAGNLFMKKL